MLDDYDFSVSWSEEDGEHVGLCAQFPSLSWLDEDATKAYCGIVALVVGELKAQKRREKAQE